MAMKPPRRFMDLRVDATPPGNMNRPPDDEDDATTQSYDAPPDEVSHGVSASVGLTLLAAVMWVSVIAGEHIAGLGSLRTASCMSFVLFFVYWWRHRRWRISLMTMLVVGAVGLVGGASAWQQVPVINGPCSGNATVRTDPTWVGHGVGVVLVLHGKRYRVIAHGVPGAHLANRLAGEHVMVTGTCSKTTGPYSRYDRITHVVGRMTVQSVSEDFAEGSMAVRAANRMRVALHDGVALMPYGLQSLFSGLVIGDDRDQSREMVNQFRASGLSHLCAVSGQNVAYLLAALSPLLRRLRRNSRFIAVLVILAWFVLLTRAEPSVLRAAVMAGLVAVNAASGTSMNARTILASTVIVLLVLDPMLAWSVGFALSVGATAGLAWLSARLGNIIGRHGMLASTLAAQVGTMPVSFFVFGYVPVVSLIANPLALWVAGMVMMVGLPLALLASLLTPLVPLVSWAMTIPVAWVAGVARFCSEVSPHGLLNVGLWLCVAGGIWHRWRQTEA
jgi:competence protein ComEC